MMILIIIVDVNCTSSVCYSSHCTPLLLYFEDHSELDWDMRKKIYRCNNISYYIILFGTYLRCRAIVFYYVFIISVTVSLAVNALFMDNFRAGEKTYQLTVCDVDDLSRARLHGRLWAFVGPRMLMARDELFPSYLDTARGTSSIHLPVAGGAV